MVKPNKNNDTEKNLNNSIGEGIFNNASLQMTSNYIAPYAIHLGASNKEVAYLSVLQSLGSALAQIPGARIVVRWSRKTVWNIAYFLSRFLWLFAVLILFLPAYQFAILMILVFLIYFFNGIRNPAWSSLMADIVPEQKRGEFFGKRNLIAGIAGLAAMMGSGLILAVFGFGFLFISSIIIGLFAIYFFSRIKEPPLRSEFHYRHSISFKPGNWIVAVRANRTFVWFTLYMGIIFFAIAMSSPFYAVVMLKTLDIGYLWYAIIITINTLFIIASQPYWGKFSDRFGDRAILIITGVMICFIPVMWLFASNIWMLIFIQIYDGFLFGGWSLVIFNFLLATVPPDKKASYIANHSFVVGMSTVGGALAGGFLVEFFQVNPSAGADGIYAVFIISFLLRLASLALLPKVQSAYKKQESEPSARLAWRLIVVEPAKTVSQFTGYAYDFRWMKKKISGFLNYVRQKTFWRYRLYRVGK
jgi:MFS family permease